MDRKTFYRSKAWENFRKVIISERTADDGYVYCAICKKPIIHKYDLIIHHKEELTEANVNDNMIALNPDNVECVHFRCHNMIHERFGFNDKSNYHPIRKKVYIVYGSPCSGKTSWVYQNATKNDLIVDLDDIWQMISIGRRYDKPASLRSVVFEVRDKLYDIIKYRSGAWHNAYVITGGAMKGDRDRLMKRIAADECIFIDTTYDECVNRIELKGLSDEQKSEWLSYIKEWFERYQPD